MCDDLVCAPTHSINLKRVSLGFPSSKTDRGAAGRRLSARTSLRGRWRWQGSKNWMYSPAPLAASGVIAHCANAHTAWRQTFERSTPAGSVSAFRLGPFVLLAAVPAAGATTVHCSCLEHSIRRPPSPVNRHRPPLLCDQALYPRNGDHPDSDPAIVGCCAAVCHLRTRPSFRRWELHRAGSPLPN